MAARARFLQQQKERGPVCRVFRVHGDSVFTDHRKSCNYADMANVYITTRGKTGLTDKKIEIAVLFCTQTAHVFLNSYSYLEAGRVNSVFL